MQDISFIAYLVTIGGAAITFLFIVGSLLPQKKQILKINETNRKKAEESYPTLYVARKRDDDSVQFLTQLTKEQLQEYIERHKNKLNNPKKNIVFIDESKTKWFDANACEIYPSKTLSEELYITKLDNKILHSRIKNTYRILNSKEAYDYMRENGYSGTEEVTIGKTASADPSKEI